MDLYRIGKSFPADIYDFLALDSKSSGGKPRAGSSPASGTMKTRQEMVLHLSRRVFVFEGTVLSD